MVKFQSFDNTIEVGGLNCSYCVIDNIYVVKLKHGPINVRKSIRGVQIKAIEHVEECKPKWRAKVTWRSHFKQEVQL